MSGRIKEWKRFQHFKDRKPPWIKLYRDLLDDPEWHELDAVAAKALTMLWLIASESEDGSLPSLKKLAFRFRMTEEAVSSILSRLSHWVILDDITTASTRYQTDAPERETERETDAAPNGAHPVVQETSDEKELFAKGKQVLGPSAGGLIVSLLKSKKGSVPQARAAIEIASTKQNPREYVGAIVRGAAEPANDFYDPMAGIQ